MSNLKNLVSEMSKARKMLIKTYALKNCDSNYTFFYDETNNIGKLYISDEDKLNVAELNNFVLGGILLLNKNLRPDLNTLKDKLRLQKSTKELKLKHIAQGNFQDIIRSPKLTFYLEWLETNNLHIHYIHIDLFFYSIVDIIDSLLCELDDLKGHHQFLKADFYELIKPHRNFLIKIFAKYNYPNLTSENKNNFLKEILSLIDLSDSRIPHFNYQMIRGLIKYSLQQSNLPFIEGYPAKQLVENFFSFYFSNVLMFENSLHIFDENIQIQKIFDEKSINEKRNIQFVSSHDQPLIQVSDIFSGLMGKFHSYLTNSSLKEIEETLELMNNTSIRNLVLLEEIISKSEKVSRALIHHTTSQHDLDKSSLIFKRAKQLSA